MRLKRGPSASIPRASTFSTTASLETAAAPRLAISRRAWKAHESTLPKVERVKPPKPEDKPWPRNMRIAGYVAAGIFIPYTTVWLITSNPSLREILAPYLPLESIRSHFGEVEWDAKSYSDQVEDQGKPLEPGIYRYPLEPSFKERQLEERIEEERSHDITTNIILVGDSQVQETKSLPGSTPATPKALASLIGTQAESQKIAVSFEDPDPSSMMISDEMAGNNETNSMETTAISGGLNLFDSPSASTPTRPLLQETQTYSSWHYHLQGLPGVQDEKPPDRASDDEIERLRLEFTVKELERLLKDPSCTRDIDDMRAELKQAKSELSSRRWKKRLGF